MTATTYRPSLEDRVDKTCEYDIFVGGTPLRGSYILKQEAYFALIPHAVGYEDRHIGDGELLLQRVHSPFTSQNQRRALDGLADKVYRHSLTLVSSGVKPRIEPVYDSSPRNGIALGGEINGKGMWGKKINLDDLPQWAQQYFGMVLQEKQKKKQKRTSEAKSQAPTTIRYWWALGPQGVVRDGPESHFPRLQSFTERDGCYSLGVSLPNYPPPPHRLARPAKKRL